MNQTNQLLMASPLQAPFKRPLYIPSSSFSPPQSLFSIFLNSSYSLPQSLFSKNPSEETKLMGPNAWSGPKDTSKKLWRIVRSIYQMFRRGIIRAVDPHLLLQRGKIAGKALGNLLASHHYHYHYHTTSGGTSYASAFSCRSMDLNTAFYSPKEVEFSCSNTPVYPSFYSTRRRNRRHRDYSYNYKVAAMAKDFEILNSEILETDVAVASPSPESEWSYGKSPVVVRQLRVTDSPFPTRDEEEVDGRIDSEAEEFIRRFYEQLRLQQCVSSGVFTGGRQW